MALKNMYRLWSSVLPFFPSRKDPEHPRELDEVHSGRCQCLPPHPFSGVTRFNNNALSLLTCHWVSTDPSVSIPAHPPPLPCSAPHIQNWLLRLSLAAPAHPPRPAESDNAATQPPETHCPHLLLAQLPLPLPVLSPAWVVSVRS